jgi:DNA-binding winged helix-turn-helix (wHTH) protein
MVFAIDVFEVDEALFELRRAGSRVDVQPKALQLICHLVRNRERVLATGELFEVLCPDQTVGPTSLPRAVREARLAVDDSGASQSTVRTARGRGYRFASVRTRR